VVRTAFVGRRVRLPIDDFVGLRSTNPSRDPREPRSRVPASPKFVDDAESVATIQAAVDAGITLLDTGDYYGMGHTGTA
jgi:hypothetical protein